MPNMRRTKGRESHAIALRPPPPVRLTVPLSLHIYSSCKFRPEQTPKHPVASMPINEMSVTSINDRAAEEYFRRGSDSEKEGNHEKAVEFFERALNENPDHEPAIFRLAVLYDRRAEDAKAIELYERICTSEPVHVNALMNLAILYEDNNHYDEAHRCLDAVLKTAPNHSRARL